LPGKEYKMKPIDRLSFRRWLAERIEDFLMYPFNVDHVIEIIGNIHDNPELYSNMYQET